MSKELDALNDLRYSGLIKNDIVCFTKKAFEKRLDIIEKALKENQRLKERLDKVCKMHSNALRKIESDRKKLKALEIIKEKRVDIYNLIYSSNVEEYNKFAMNYNQELCNTLLTQEEYDLLKEVLL